MSEFRIDQISNQAGTAGPDIAGITTFSSTSGMLMPSGNTIKRNIIENIVTNGLVLFLDAENDLSYPGSGTLWRDLSEELNNGTLINSPLFSTNYISFNGTNQNVEIPYSKSPFRQTSAITYSFLIKINSFDINQSANIAGTRVSGGNGTGGITIFKNLLGEEIIRFNWTPTTPLSDNQISSKLINSSVNNWNHFTFTYNYSNVQDWKFYQNGILLTNREWFANNVTNAIPSTSFNQSSNDTIGSRYINSMSYANCDISNFSLYNRALTSQEVQQNFNALKGRFGL
jgi:hypothetical protein